MTNRTQRTGILSFSRKGITEKRIPLGNAIKTGKSSEVDLSSSTSMVQVRFMVSEPDEKPYITKCTVLSMGSVAELKKQTREGLKNENFLVSVI